MRQIEIFDEALKESVMFVAHRLQRDRPATWARTRKWTISVLTDTGLVADPEMDDLVITRLLLNWWRIQNNHPELGPSDQWWAWSPNTRDQQVDVDEANLRFKRASYISQAVELGGKGPLAHEIIARVTSDGRSGFLAKYDASKKLHEFYIPSAGEMQQELNLENAHVVTSPTESLHIIADLDVVPPELITELMAALDELHRAHGGGGLRVLRAHTGSEVFEGAAV